MIPPNNFNSDASGTIESILLPISGGPHTDFAGEIARSIARVRGAHVELVRVVDPDAPAEDHADAETMLENSLSEFDDVDAEATVVEDNDVSQAIAGWTAAHDLTILGATREGLLQKVIFGSIPEEIGERAENTVILARQNLGITSHLRRLLRQSEQASSVSRKPSLTHPESKWNSDRSRGWFMRQPFLHR